MKVLIFFFSLIALLSVPAKISFAQDPLFNLDSINFKSEEARRAFEKIPEQSKRVIMGLAPAPTLSPETMAMGLKAGFYSLAERYKFEKDSPEWNYHYERILERKDFIKAQLPGSGKPLKHIRFRSGDPVPSLQDITQHLAASYYRARDKAKPKRNKNRRPVKLSAESKEEIEDFYVIKKPKCEVSSSAALDMPPGFLEEGEAADLLFFDGLPPFDVATAVGAQTNLIIFGHKDHVATASSYGTLPISCLPFRLKSDGKTVFYAQGSDALRNFDASPGSKGTLDPTVKKYLEQEGIK